MAVSPPPVTLSEIVYEGLRNRGHHLPRDRADRVRLASAHSVAVVWRGERASVHDRARCWSRWQ